MDDVSSFKRCGCRDPLTGRPLDSKCPKLRRGSGWNSRHGTWYGKAELQAGPDGKRVTLRAGGFRTETELEGWFGAALALAGIPEKGPDGHQARTEILALIRASRRAKASLPGYDEIQRLYQAGASFDPGTAGQYLLSWVKGREKELAISTLAGYRLHVRLFAEAFGHVPLGKLRTRHVQPFFDGLAAEHARVETARASEDPDVRASVRGLQPAGPATRSRYKATLRSALNDAMNGPEKLVASNAAAGVRTGGSGKRPKAKEWTPERVAGWRPRYEAAIAGLPGSEAPFRVWKRTAMRPSPVMFWTPEQTGRFLDYAAGDRLYAMWHVIIFRGPRRGEVCGLPWTEVNFDGAVIDVSTQLIQVGWTVTETTPKTEASDAPVPLDSATIAVLRAWRKVQVAERLATGPAWVNSGKVFTQPDGSALRPSWVSDEFQRLAFRAGLPPIREHDARHGAANLAIKAGAREKEVQALMRHESYQTSMDVYASVFAAQSADLAERMVAAVPRRSAGRAAGPTSVPISSRRRVVEQF